jgi:branched-chain amino acid transport system substrate-binding protein
VISVLRISAAALLLVTLGPAPAPSQEPIKLGINLPLSGQHAEYVKRYLVAPTEFAVREVNDRGGLLGRPVKVISEDSRYEPASAVSALRKLADIDGVLAIFTGFTPLTLPQLPVAEEKRIIVLAPSTEHPDLTKSRWAVRMTPTGDKPPIRAAQIAAGLGAKTAVMLAEDNEAVRISERAFKSEFERSGGKVLASESFRPQDTDMRGQLTKLRAARADVLFVWASAGRSMALALKQMHEVGFRPKHVLTNHLIEDREVKTLGPDAIEGIIYTTLKVDPAFAARFKTALGYDPDANAGKHYDATMLLFEAIRRAGTADDRVKVRDAIYNFGEFRGVLGQFKFSGSGEPGIFPSVKTIKGGQYVDYEAR